MVFYCWNYSKTLHSYVSISRIIICLHKQANATQHVRFWKRHKQTLRLRIGNNRRKPFPQIIGNHHYYHLNCEYNLLHMLMLLWFYLFFGAHFHYKKREGQEHRNYLGIPFIFLSIPSFWLTFEITFYFVKSANLCQLAYEIFESHSDLIFLSLNLCFVG